MNEFENYFSLIHNEVKLNIDFYQFKNSLIKYAEQVMNSFLGEKAQCNCYIKPLEKDIKGSEGFVEETNTFQIIISEKVVKSIYDGTNPLNIFVLFHEIAHVYDEFNIKNKNFKDANLKKVCIDRGIRRMMPNGRLFYDSNYESIAIESHANLIGAQLTRDFYKNCNSELNDIEQKGLLLLEFFALKELNNVNRDFNYLFDGSMYNEFKLPLNKIVIEIESRYPNIYNNFKKIVGEENLSFEDEEQQSEFETKLYSEYAIMELSDIINNPLFTSLVEDKAQHRPKI